MGLLSEKAGTGRMASKIQKSYTTQDPVLAYCNNSSSPLHPVQQKLIEETVQHNRGRMMAAAESINLNALLIRSLNAKKVLDMTHSQMLGKVEFGGGPIFKVVLEC